MALENLPRVAALMGAQHGVATRHQLHSAGLSDRRISTLVKRRCLIRLRPGAYADEAIWSTATMAARHAMSLLGIQLSAPDTVGVVLTAAVAWGLPVRRIPERPVVARDRDKPVLKRADVRRIALSRADVTSNADLRITTLPRTVVDVAGEAAFPDALITVDAALRRGVTRKQLDAQLTRLVGAKAHRANAAIEAGDPASESALESLSRGRGIEAGLPPPLCNLVIRRGGRWGRVDELWLPLGIVGEADGRLKYQEGTGSPDALWLEKQRQDWLEDMGLAVLRWGFHDVADDGQVLSAKYGRAALRQKRYGFTWPDDVTIELPQLPGVQVPQRVIDELRLLQLAGYPVVGIPTSDRLSDVARF